MNNHLIHQTTNIRVCVGILMSTWCFAAFAADTFEDVSDSTIPVQPEEVLEVKLHDADIRIVSHDRNEVAVRVTKVAAADDEQEAQEMFERFHVEISKSAEGVQIESKETSRSWNGIRRGLDVKVEVRVPQRFHCNVRTTDGDIHMEDLTGNLKVQSSDGDIRLVQLEGELSWMTSDGDISAQAITGRLSASSSDGDISISRFKGSIQTQTQDGDLMVEILETPERDCQFKTSDGDISLSVPADIRASFHIAVNDGDVDFAFPMDQEVKSGDSQVINTNVNGGGVRFSIVSADGDIRVRKGS